MALNFPNVTVLGLTQDARFFEAGFQYASFKRLSIAGNVQDLTVGFGITGTWSGQQGMLKTIQNNQNYQPLILNGVNFGSGRIDSMSFDPGIDVQLKGYTANITVYDSGNLFNFTGLYYSGIDTSNFSQLNSLSESYSFDRKQNGGYGYVHNASIQFISGANQLFAIGAAQNLAKTLFTGSNLGFAFYPAGTNKQGKRYVTETYNLIDNSCGFEERFDFDNDNGAYSTTYTTAVNLNEEGVVTATENGTIRGIENPNYQKALSAVNVEMTGSYYRCSGAANYYFPTGAILVNDPTVQGRSFDIFNNVIQYTVSFDNSPTNQKIYTWDYTLQAAKQDGVTTVTEQGTIVGQGPNPTDAFANARAGFSIVQPGIPTRVTAMFTAPYLPSTNYLESKGETYAPVQGQLGYTYTYSNDPTLIANVGVRRVAVTEDDTPPIYLYNKLNVINQAEIAQLDYQGSVGSTNITVELEGDKTMGLYDFLPVAVAQFNTYAPVGNDMYVGGVSYSYDPNQNTVNAQLTWLYNLPVGQTLYPP